MHALWQDWMEVARKAQRVPTLRQYEKYSKYSPRPLKARFQRWDKIPLALLEYGDTKELWNGWEDVKQLLLRRLEDSTEGKTYRTGVQMSARACTPALWRALATPPPEVIDAARLYSQPLNLNPLATVPENEMGVVFLFGVLARELGFIVLKIKPGFPDCIALRRLENGKWQWVRIEFEFESRSFQEHGHDLAECDLIICWENNWPECPLEVLELKRAFRHQQPAFSAAV